MKTTLRFVVCALLATAFFACSKKEEAKMDMKADSTSASMAMADSAGDRGQASAMFGEMKVSIDYGRPKLEGRDMLAQATEGKVWRMGKNEATEITTDADLKFGETTIPKGHYSLWMKKVSEGNWQLIFNKKTGIWGTAHTDADDFATVPMTMATNPESVEAFTISLESTGENMGVLKAMWGTSILSADFAVVGASSM